MRSPKLKLVALILLFMLGIVIVKKIAAADTVPAYDLKVESITISPEKPELNKDCTITIIVVNDGTGTLSDSGALSQFEYNFNNFKIRSQSTGNIPASLTPGQKVIYSFSGSFIDLNKQGLSFTIDNQKQLEEKDENNNTLTKDVIVQGNDLFVEGIEVSPAKPAVNQDILVKVKIKNNGSKPLYTSIGFTNYSYSFDNFEFIKLNNNLPSMSNIIQPGEYVYFNFEGKFLRKGTAALAFEINKNYELEEKTHDNNSLKKEIDVIAENQDIAFDSIEVTPESVIVNSEVIIKATVKNTGSSSLASSLGFTREDIINTFFGFTLSEFTHEDYPSLSNPLDPEEKVSYSFKGKFDHAGKNSLALKIDKNNLLTEADENNNATTTLITVYLNQQEADAIEIIKPEVNYISTSSVRVSWETNKKAAGKVLYYVDGYSGTEYENKIDEKKLAQQLDINDLKAGTSYIYRINAVNGSFSKETGPLKFTLPLNDEVKVIGKVNALVDGKGKSAIIKWSTNLLSSGKVYYRKQGTEEYKEAGSDDKTTNHEVLLKDLEYGRYEYYFISSSIPGTKVTTESAIFELAEEIIFTPPQAGDKKNEEHESILSQPQPAVKAIVNNKLFSKLTGKIIIRAEAKGEAYYINPQNKTSYSLGRPEEAFNVIRSQGKGITNANLEKIPVGLNNLSGTDSDKDGLPDAFEDALGLNKNNADSDGDGYKDKEELAAGYSAKEKLKKINHDNSFTNIQKGKIFIQTEGKGEAWYVNPADGKRYFLGRPADAFNLMKKLGAGISEKDFGSL